MARSLHFPADLNLDNARPLAPQWMTNQQDASGAGTQNIKSALVEQPSGGGQKGGGWGSSDPPDQKHERGGWRTEDKGGEPQPHRPWAAPGEQGHLPGTQDRFALNANLPGQQDRFAPQVPRPRPGPGSEITPPPKGDRWRDDGQSRWGHGGNQGDHGPQQGWGADQFAPGPGDTWQRQRQQRPQQGIGNQGNRADGRWGAGGGGIGGGGGWGGPEDHYTQRPSNWEGGGGGRGVAPGIQDHGRDALGAGRGRGFSHYGRGRPLGKEPLGGAPQRGWQAPGQDPAPSPTPAHQHPTPRGDDIIVPKLGTGPQRHKYTVEQMLSLFAGLSEGGGQGLATSAFLREKGAYLPPELDSPETRHHLLSILEGISQQMIEGGFASKAERRLASRLHALLEVSVQPAKPEPPVEEQPPNPAPPAADKAPGGSPFAADQGQGSQQAEAPANQADEWFYKDPAGNIQGPYGKQDIQEWYTSGFFPLDLPLARTRDAPASAYKTLGHMLEVWGLAAPAEDTSSHPGKRPDQQTHNWVTEASMRLDDAEAGVGLGVRGTSRQGSEPHPHLPQDLDRPGSHPYMGEQPPLNRHPSYPNQPDPRTQQHEFSALTTLNQQLNSLGIEPEHPSYPRDLQQNRHLMQSFEEAGRQGHPQNPSLLSQLQNPQQRGWGTDVGRREHEGGHGGHAPHQGLSPQFSGPPPDPIVDLLGSLGPQAAPGARMPYQPPPQQFQQQQQQHPQYSNAQYDGHSALQDILGLNQGSYQRSERQQELLQQMEYRAQEQQQQPSYSQYSPPMPQPPHQQQHQQQQAQPFQAGAYRPQQPALGESQGPSVSLNTWLSPQPSQQPQPQPQPQPTRQQAGKEASPPRPTDEVVPPSRLAPPQVAAVGPPPRKLEPPPPPTPAQEDAPFQKVQKSKRKEAGNSVAEPEDKVAPPPPRKAPVAPPAQAEQEWQRPQPTLAEAAGFPQDPPQEPPSAPAPWSAVQAGAGRKSILDIQREEAAKAKLREEQEAAQAAAAAAAAAAAGPAPGPTSWGKAVLRAVPSAAMSFAEIQEQEKRRSAAAAPEPATAASGPPPSWAAAPKVAKISEASESIRKPAAAPKAPKAIPVTRAAPKPAVKAVPVTKPVRAQPVKPPVDDADDDMFWDYGPPAKTTAAAGQPSKPAAGKQPPPAPERKGSGPANGSTVQRPAAAAPAPAAAGKAPPAKPPASEPAAESQTDGFDASLSPEFASWCKMHLRELRGGDDDLTLVQYLMTVASNAEIADYMQHFLGRTPAVSAFANEFIKRKLVEQNGKKKGKGKKAVVNTPAAGSGIGVAPVSAGGATGWSKMPKKKKKGQKVDATMLGFGTGTNYAALEKLEN